MMRLFFAPFWKDAQPNHIPQRQHSFSTKTKSQQNQSRGGFRRPFVMAPNNGAPPPKKKSPLAVAIGICAGVTIGGIVIKAGRLLFFPKKKMACFKKSNEPLCVVRSACVASPPRARARRSIPGPYTHILPGTQIPPNVTGAQRSVAHFIVVFQKRKGRF